MIDDVWIDYFLDFAASKDIKVRFTDELSKDTPSVSFAKDRIAIINLNATKPNQIVFQLCHEIGHILCNHREKIVLEYSTRDTGIELEANVKAIDLLLSAYAEDKSLDQLNVVNFMNYFCIPESLISVVQKQFMKFIRSNM